MFTKMLLGIWLLSLSACGGTVENDLRVYFPDQTALDAVSSMQVYVIVPAESSSCDALLFGQARPDHPGYSVQDGFNYELRGEDPLPVLKDIGPGHRLFFAEACDGSDCPLCGCTEAESGAEGPNTIVIELMWEE